MIFESHGGVGNGWLYDKGNLVSSEDCLWFTFLENWEDKDPR